MSVARLLSALAVGGLASCGSDGPDAPRESASAGPVIELRSESDVSGGRESALSEEWLLVLPGGEVPPADAPLSREAAEARGGVVIRTDGDGRARADLPARSVLVCTLGSAGEPAPAATSRACVVAEISPTRPVRLGFGEGGLRVRS